MADDEATRRRKQREADERAIKKMRQRAERERKAKEKAQKKEVMRAYRAGVAKAKAEEKARKAREAQKKKMRGN